MTTYHELPTDKEFRDNLLPRLQDTSFRCALCTRTFARISGAHLRSHADFLLAHQGKKPVRKSEDVIAAEQEMFPDRKIDPWTERPEKLSEIYTRLFGGTSLLNAIIQKTLSLYAPNRTEWTLMEHLENKAEWITITEESTGWEWHSNLLTTDRLKEHFLGRLTIGVKARGNWRTKVIVFDVDAVPQYGERPSDAEARAKRTTRAIVRVLMRHKLTPHVVGSGSKGYHVELYFDALIPNTMVKNLYSYVTNHPDVPMDGVKVECLPLKRAIKLPLGIHWGAKKFTTFVDPLTLIPVADPYSYYLRIRPMERTLMDDFVPEDKATKPRKRKTHLDESWSAQATEIAFKVGIEARGTRHNTTLRAAAYAINHFKPETYEEFYDLLVRWSQKQYQEHGANIRTSWFHHLRDLERIATYVWKYRFSGGLNMSVDFTASDVHWIRSQTANLATQRLLLAALYQQRITGGHFFFGTGRMEQLTKLSHGYLAASVKELRDAGILEVVGNHSHQKGLGKSKSRKYALTKLPEQYVVEAVLVTVTEKTWTPDLWFQLLQMVFTPQQIRNMYPFAHHRILAVTPINSKSQAARVC
ncbi:hypothetical protein [Alicyclobacillus macrosporangiidus]|uniref:hypothetical protein n=1 Tax=Alicyclobacillus macrosporangiidus TaxID=392015 RepID=UPI00049606BB|nr:hypothetical protein [Alicyclobacillus macrosporangiidus]